MAVSVPVDPVCGPAPDPKWVAAEAALLSPGRNNLDQVAAERFVGAGVPGEWSRMLRDPRLPGVEALQAHFTRYRYAPHWHETVCIAVVGGGAAAFDCAGQRYVAPAGSVFVIPAGEIHTGEPAAPAGLNYRVLYVDPDRITELVDSGRAAPKMDPGDVVHRRTAAGSPLVWFHRAMAGAATSLEREHALLTSVAAVATEFGGLDLRDDPTPEHRAVRRARDYLHAHATDPVTLRELADVAGLSMYRLARTFGAQVGIPPHAYQVQLRVLRAKRLLEAGQSIGDAAVSCGFFDQAHLTNQFKRRVGVTPGDFVRGIVD
jgi:AraC-like DNA-binding protein